MPWFLLLAWETMAVLSPRSVAQQSQAPHLAAPLLSIPAANVVNLVQKMICLGVAEQEAMLDGGLETGILQAASLLGLHIQEGGARGAVCCVLSCVVSRAFQKCPGVYQSVSICTVLMVREARCGRRAAASQLLACWWYCRCQWCLMVVSYAI